MSHLNPHLKPYWGKLAVRNFRGSGGSVGIIEARLAPLPYSTHPTTRLYEVWQKEANRENAPSLQIAIHGYPPFSLLGCIQP